MSPRAVSLKLPAGMLKQVDAAARRELLSRSDIIRRLIAAGLREQQPEGARS